MLKVGIIDANERTRGFEGITASVVGQWIGWELEQAGIEKVSPDKADLVFLVFAGALDWEAVCKRELRRWKIPIDVRKRGQKPYVVTGGPVDSTPLTALETADVVAVGEGYTIVREILKMVDADYEAKDIDRELEQYDHAITFGQIKDHERDIDRPWLFDKQPDPLASPDEFIDWKTPNVKSSDQVIRIVGSKGCHMKCLFCATTYRQNYQMNPDGNRVVHNVNNLRAKGERVQILSNDPLNIPWFRDLTGRLDSESFTIQEVMDRGNRAAIIRTKPKMARFGVEGISERIRKAFAKPIGCTHLLQILNDFHSKKVNTHMFFIVGAPYESEADWVKLRRFWQDLTLTLGTGLCRVKFTTFLPTPPAPLVRFVPGKVYEQRMTDFRQWVGANAASPNVLYVRGRGNETRTKNVAEQLAVGKEVAAKLCSNDETYDLAPSAEDFAKMQQGIVRWPMALAKQWKISETYRKRLA